MISIRIDRGAASLAVEGTQMLADAGQIHEPVNRPQQVIRGNMPLQTEAVEQRLLRHRPLAHHRPVSARSRKLNQDSGATSRPTFSTQSGR